MATGAKSQRWLSRTEELRRLMLAAAVTGLGLNFAQGLELWWPGSRADPTLATYMQATTALTASGAEICALRAYLDEPHDSTDQTKTP